MSEEEPFKVTDRRRRFDEDVEPVGGRPAPEAPAATPRTGEERASTAVPDPAASDPDLQNVFLMFESSALIGLGEAPDPSTGLQRIDLDQAQDAFETLVLLRVKTEGNRTEVESRLLDEILYDLQARFVRLSQGGGAGLR